MPCGGCTKGYSVREYLMVICSWLVEIGVCGGSQMVTEGVLASMRVLATWLNGPGVANMFRALALK